MTSQGTHILSFGGGVNSTSLLVLALQDKIKVDVVAFSDTQNEFPETYKHIEETIKPLCKQNNIPFYEITNGDLRQDYYDKNIIPFRAFRSCTDRYKIRPLHKFVKEKFGEDVTWIIGIDYGEKHRAEKFRYYKSKHIFPLIEMEIDREGCKQIIEDFGLEVPVKSGCYFCPFTNKQGWIDLLENHRDLFLKAEEFEKNNRQYPKATFTRKSLEQIRKAIDNQQSLCDFIDTEETPCIFCHS